ncbi:MAG: hypothetical protein ACI8UP_003952 [Porticoccaceae bacterium]|jgi:hypothetical protein
MFMTTQNIHKVTMIYRRRRPELISLYYQEPPQMVRSIISDTNQLH